MENKEMLGGAMKETTRSEQITGQLNLVTDDMRATIARLSVKVDVLCGAEPTITKEGGDAAMKGAAPTNFIEALNFIDSELRVEADKLTRLVERISYVL